VPRVARISLLAQLLLATLALATIAPPASAYFTGQAGNATGGSSIGTLSATVLSTPTPGAGTATLSWSAVTPPAGGTVTYYVKRAGGTVGGNCPSSPSTATTSLTCTDTGLSQGTYTYTVTAVWQSWSATSASAQVMLTSGKATQIVLSGSTSALTSGSTRTLTATLEDGAGNVATDDNSDTVTFGTTAGPGTVTGLSTVTVSAGVATDTVTGALAGSVTLDATGTYGGSAVTSNSLAFTVTFGTASHIVLSGSTANLSSGTTRVLTATIEDAAGNTVTSGTDSTDSITFAKSTGTGTVTGLTSVAASAGVATDTVTGSVAGSITLEATGTLAGASKTSNTLTFTLTFGTASKIVLSGSTASLQSGTTRLLTATIEDAAGNTVTSGADSTDSITFARSTGTGTVTGLTSVAASAGVATDTVTGSVAGSITLDATATVAGSAKTSNTLTFTITGPSPSSIAISNHSGGVAGKPEAGDTIVLTYSSGLKMTSICSASTLGNTTAGSITPHATSSTVTLTTTTTTSVSFSSTDCTLDIGTISINATGYGTGTLTFAGSSVQWNGSNTITITLGSTITGTQGTHTASATVTYTPSTSITDPAGNAISGTASSTAELF
jgi:hypothetical protein